MSASDQSAPVQVDGQPIDYNALPFYMQDGMRGHIEQRRPVGTFLTAVLSNDLYTAVRHADDTNRDLLHVYVNWLYMNAPPGSYGSAEQVQAWRAGRTV